MNASPAAAEAMPGGGMMIGRWDRLLRQPVFRTRDLEQGRAHMCGVLGDHGVAYLSRERCLDLRHREAKVGSIAVNSLQYGAGVMINAPLLPDFYLLQFTLAGECRMWQQTHHSILPAGSVAVVNPGQGFKKAWLPGTRQLLLRINARLVEREFRAWTGGEAGGIEFDMPPIDNIARVGTLLRYVRMLCDDLRSDASSLSHPLVADRVASGLVSIRLTSMPRAKMGRLAPHRGYTITALVEELIENAEWRVTARLPSRALKAYYDAE